MAAKMLHCSICGKPVAKMSLTLDSRFAKLREHRKKAHPAEHEKSVKKALKTRMKRSRK